MLNTEASHNLWIMQRKGRNRLWQ